jgi:hypothetical protein
MAGMNKKLGGMQEEVAMTKVLSPHFPGRTEENHRKPQDIQFPSQYSNTK